MVDMREPLEDPPLGYLLYRVHNALRSEVTSTVLEPLGLAFPQYICMRILARYPDRSNAELARDTNVSPQAMNMVLRGLEERGLVTRPANVSSGRSLPAALTREGEELLDRTDAGVKGAEQRLMAKLSSRQCADFKQILAALGSDPSDVSPF
jgi:DNA-binding MarR family transcriptional regulator